MSELRIAVVGLGPWGRNLLRAFSATEGARVVAVCDENPARLRDAPVRAGGVKAVTALGEVLGDDGLDAVILATPPPSHAAQCLAALDARKHVFVEKPMAMSGRDAARIEASARAARRTLMVGHILRYHPALLRLLELVSSGELGQVRRVHSARLGAAGLADHETMWWTLAPHDVSVMCALLGTEPTSVTAGLGPPLHDGRRAVRATLTFANGCTGTVVTASGVTQKTRRIVVVGSLKTAVFDDVEPTTKLRVYPTSGDGVDPWTASVDTATPHAVITTSPVEPLLLEARHFVAALREGRPVPTDAAEGRAVVRVLEAACRSLRNGGGVTVTADSTAP